MHWNNAEFLGFALPYGNSAKVELNCFVFKIIAKQQVLCLHYRMYSLFELILVNVYD